MGVIENLKDAVSLLSSSSEPQTPQALEDAHFIFLASLAAAKEAADAFREADQYRWFGRPLVDDPEIGCALARAREECSKKSSASLYRRVFRPARDAVVGHWRRDRIQQLLGQHADDRFPVFAGGSTYSDSAVPLTTALAFEAAGFALDAGDSQRELVLEIGRLQHDLFKVAEAAYSVAVVDRLRELEGSDR
jgi:hypothetical protein